MCSIPDICLLLLNINWSPLSLTQKIEHFWSRVEVVKEKSENFLRNFEEGISQVLRQLCLLFKINNHYGLICYSVIISHNIWLILPGTQLFLDSELEVESYRESSRELGLFKIREMKDKEWLIDYLQIMDFSHKKMVLDYCSEKFE